MSYSAALGRMRSIGGSIPPLPLTIKLNIMENLYTKLKPKVKRKLLDNNVRYKISVDSVVKDLKSVNFYTDLKMSTIHTLMVMSSTDPKDQWDLKWGDCFFNNK